MTRSLSTKLVLAFLSVAAASIILFAFFSVWATRVRFNEFVLNRDQVELVNLLTTYYQANGSWEGVQDIFTYPPSAGPGQGYGPGRGWRGEGQGPNAVPYTRRPIVVADAGGIVVVAGLNYYLGDYIAADQDLLTGVPLTVNDETVGTLYIRPEDIPPPLGSEDTFLASVTQAVVLSGLVAAALALFLGFILARSLTGPLRDLTQATRRMAAGDLEQQVTVRSQDELGELATSFNQMSSDLSQAINQRRQMTADIAHDLRTPLSVILGYTEMLKDGLMPGDQETFTILHEEAQQLNRLVEDLRTLTLADAGELPLLKEPIQPQELLARAVNGLGPQARLRGVTLEIVADEDLPLIVVDPDRMDQVFDNLLSNALRHTPAGGRITLGATRQNGQVQLKVADTGEGIAPEDLPHIFDRFYQADKARSDDTSGLGLAISRSIVRLHHGQIQVQSQPGRGTTFVIQLPVLQG